MATRFVARQDNGNTYDFWYWEDNGSTNDPTYWTNLIRGATTVVAEVATAAEEGPPPKAQGPWQAFTVQIVDDHCRAIVGGMAKDREWVIRATIDGVTYDQFSVRVA